MVYIALLGLLNGGSFGSDDANALGAILTVGTVACLLLGLLIVIVAICKLHPKEPWVTVRDHGEGAGGGAGGH